MRLLSHSWTESRTVLSPINWPRLNLHTPCCNAIKEQGEPLLVQLQFVSFVSEPEFAAL